MGALGGLCAGAGLQSHWQLGDAARKKMFRNFYSQFFLPLSVNPESQGNGDTKGTVLLSGVWTQFPERRARSFWSWGRLLRAGAPCKEGQVNVLKLCFSCHPHWLQDHQHVNWLVKGLQELPWGGSWREDLHGQNSQLSQRQTSQLLPALVASSSKNRDQISFLGSSTAWSSYPPPPPRRTAEVCSISAAGHISGIGQGQSTNGRKILWTRLKDLSPI